MPRFLALARRSRFAVRTLLRRRLLCLRFTATLGSSFGSGNPLEARPAGLAATLFRWTLLCCFLRRHPQLDSNSPIGSQGKSAVRFTVVVNGWDLLQ